jgi:acyl carrier protein
VVSKSGGLDKPALRAYMQEKLPGYMVPGYIIGLEHLPLTVNGKIDRRSLPLPSGTEKASGRHHIGARTATEEKLIAIWSEVLGMEAGHISITDNFFDLGGHSLKAIQLAARINAAFDVQLSIRSLFFDGTIENIGEQISFLLNQHQQREDKEKRVTFDF